jgi:hypothetical protein
MNAHPWEVLAEQRTQARFSTGPQAFLYAHFLVATGREYVRVVDHGHPDVEAIVSWRFEYGGDEMPVAVREEDVNG